MPARNPFPPRDGNAFRLLAEPETYLTEMELAIHRAKHYVLLEQYLVNSGALAQRFFDALIAARQRGVKVLMLIDHFGARGLSGSDRDRLQQHGIIMGWYNPTGLHNPLRSLLRNHRKLLLVDGERAFTGGSAISDAYLPGGSQPPWHDVMLEMQGPVVTDWQTLFMQTWRRWHDEIELPAPATLPATSGTQSARLSPSFRGLRKFIRHAFLRQTRMARERVWLATAYFLPNRRMLRSLRLARRRGVDVRLLLPGPINDHPIVYHAGRRYYGQLLRAGVRIFEYQPAFLHAKLFLCDGYGSVGSCNLDRWGLRWNLEANLESEDMDFCHELRTFFESTLQQSQEISLAEWQARPASQRFREWLFGYVDLILERFGQLWAGHHRNP